MIAKKPGGTKSQRRSAGKYGRTSDWRGSLRRRLTKVREIDGIFVVKEGAVVHVFTVMEDHQSDIYGTLMKQERLVEKDHPSIEFDLHTRLHQGRPPHRAVPYGAEKVFLK